MDAINSWVAFFAGACRRAVSDAEAFEHRVSELPIITVQSGAALVCRSVQAVNEAIPRLVDAGVLTQTTVGKRNRAFEAKELIDSFTALERQLASPDGDTRSSPPSRRVPARRSG